MKELQTERLLLRPFRETDLADLYEFLSQRRDAEFEAYPDVTPESCRKYLDFRISSESFYAMELSGTGKVIGNIYCADKPFESKEVGYLVNKDYQRRGYAFEALSAVMENAFREGTHRVFAECDPRNDCSWRLLKKIGLRREGLLRKNVFFRRDAHGAPVWNDTCVYGILAEEWPDRRTPEKGEAPVRMETERLILRPWEITDAEECFRYARDPRVGPMAGWPAHQSPAESRRIIRDVLAVPETYAIVWKETGLPIGTVGLNRPTLIASGDREAELGYWLGVPWWGRGIMPEAAGRLLRRAFEDLGLERVWCCYYEGNEKSKRVQEKLGFRYVRTDENVPVPLLGERRTDVVNCMTKEDWTVLCSKASSVLSG